MKRFLIALAASLMLFAGKCDKECEKCASGQLSPELCKALIEAGQCPNDCRTLGCVSGECKEVDGKYVCVEPTPVCPTCPPGQHCDDPAVGCIPDPPTCPDQCPPGTVCTDPAQGCVEPPDCRTLGCPAGATCEYVGVPGSQSWECVVAPPPDNPCPKDLAPGAYAYLNDKPYGNGFDSTVRVHGDTAFCNAIHGEPINDCHLEGWPTRVECETKLIGGCPVWQFAVDAQGTLATLCHDDHDALASCDHFGNPEFRDDPQTPTTGDSLATLQGFEGEPKVCGLQRDSFGPKAGYFTIPHGRAYIRACGPSLPLEACGPWRAFDH